MFESSERRGNLEGAPILIDHGHCREPRGAGPVFQCQAQPRQRNAGGLTVGTPRYSGLCAQLVSGRSSPHIYIFLLSLTPDVILFDPRELV